MPAQSSDLRIKIELNGKSFSLNCRKLYDGSYAVKVGRSRSVKTPYATITKIFELSRKWAVKNA